MTAKNLPTEAQSLDAYIAGVTAYNTGVNRSPFLAPAVHEMIAAERPAVGDGFAASLFGSFMAGWDDAERTAATLAEWAALVEDDDPSSWGRLDMAPSN